ncbi:MAG: acetate kinase [Planctomycetes bacterium]|nr:acetate kinase [Planctomycetota bacterium]
MKILVLNSGSSSIKYKCCEMPERRVLASGLCERIGEPHGRLAHHAGGREAIVEQAFPDHSAALEKILALLTGAGGVLQRKEEIDGVGHRLVHGGEEFSGSVLVDDAVVAAVRANIPLAPLHNPPNLLGLEVARRLLPGVPQVGVFDTAFHQGMEPRAYLYALPYELYREDRIRRYGFHGTSHAYVSRRAARLLGRRSEEVNVITCHLGNGCSMAAVQGGRSVDTSMGFTPLEGLVMGTRPGDFDPAIILYLMKDRAMSADDVNRMLNKQSGLLGLSGKTNDMREIEAGARDGDERAALALEVFCYRVKKYIGAMTAVLGRADALVFTAGVGENSATVRAKSLSGLADMGYALDAAKNAAARGVEADISTATSRARILVIPTDEEIAIAEETFALISG